MEPAQRSGIGRVSALLVLPLILMAPGGAALAGDRTSVGAVQAANPMSSLRVAAGGSDGASPIRPAQHGDSRPQKTVKDAGSGESRAGNGKLELEREALDNARLEREREIKRAREREAERARHNEEMLQRQRDAQKHSIERTLRYPEVRPPGDQDRDRDNN